jgi:uncharacterized membrane protein YdjX (TVP38/TMEM64 family)
METIINDVINFIYSLGLIGGIVSVFLIFVEAIFPILPLIAFVIVNITIFGTALGFILSVIATIMGGTFVFMLSRRVFKEKVFTYLDKHPKYNIVKSISKGINKISLPGLSLIIACPFTPSFVINIGSGLSNIIFEKYILSMIIGKFCMIYFIVFVGTNVREVFHNPIAIVKIILAFIGAYLLSLIANKITKKYI